ncbi:MAG: hypothetical protein HW377_1175, partial [Actinobacteria bacterium]|nr:hypothetical protein [Actinomycetota bacterium]
MENSKGNSNGFGSPPAKRLA